MKDNVTYYRHYADSHNHPKFKMLRVQFGWEGEGRFWALNNMIATASGCVLDLEKKYIKASVASDLGMSISEFNEFVDYLLNECELLVIRDGKITTKEVQENLKRVSVDREAARKRKLKGVGINPQNDPQNAKTGTQNESEKDEKNPKNVENDESAKSSGELAKGSGDQNKKVKESKVKESKVKESKTLIAPFEIFWDSYGKKKDRAVCEKIFNKLSDAKQQAAIDGIPAYLSTISSPKYQMYPARYLRNERWLDEVLPSAGSETSGLPKEITFLHPVFKKGFSIPLVPRESGDYSANLRSMSIFLTGGVEFYEDRQNEQPIKVLYLDFYKKCLEKLAQNVES